MRLLFFTFVFALFIGSLIGQSFSLLTFSGLCDASGAVALDQNTFVVADDETNALYVYRIDQEKPVSVFSLKALGFSIPAEGDIEAGTLFDHRLFWIGSHGRNQKGKWSPARHQFFAVQASPSEKFWTLERIGNAYSRLVFFLLQDPRYEAFDISESVQWGVEKISQLAPKKNGFNIEGLCSMPHDSSLYIGLRNPRPKGKALVIPLKNPSSVVSKNAAPQFGNPILLDLGGLGIRDMVFVPQRNAILILAGSHDTKHLFRFYVWSGKENEPASFLPVETAWMEKEDFTPEALIAFPERDSLLILSDDGNVSRWDAKKRTRCPCKRLSDPHERTFRGVWIYLEKGLNWRRVLK